MEPWYYPGQKEKDDIDTVTWVKIQRKWQIDSVVINQRFNGRDSKVSYPGSLEDYMDFKTDGNMHTYFQSKNHISVYKVRNDKTITIDGDSGDILKLTESKFILHTNAEAGGLGYLETTYYLKR